MKKMKGEFFVWKLICEIGAILLFISRILTHAQDENLIEKMKFNNIKYEIETNSICE